MLTCFVKIGFKPGVKCVRSTAPHSLTPLPCTEKVQAVGGSAHGSCYLSGTREKCFLPRPIATHSAAHSERERVLVCGSCVVKANQKTCGMWVWKEMHMSARTDKWMEHGLLLCFSGLQDKALYNLPLDYPSLQRWRWSRRTRWHTLHWVVFVIQIFRAQILKKPLKNRLRKSKSGLLLSIFPRANQIFLLLPFRRKAVAYFALSCHLICHVGSV